MAPLLGTFNLYWLLSQSFVQPSALKAALKSVWSRDLDTRCDRLVITEDDGRYCWSLATGPEDQEHNNWDRKRSCLHVCVFYVCPGRHVSVCCKIVSTVLIISSPRQGASAHVWRRGVQGRDGAVRGGAERGRCPRPVEVERGTSQSFCCMSLKSFPLGPGSVHSRSALVDSGQTGSEHPIGPDFCRTCQNERESTRVFLERSILAEWLTCVGRSAGR